MKQRKQAHAYKWEIGKTKYCICEKKPDMLRDNRDMQTVKKKGSKKQGTLNTEDKKKEARQ